EGVLRGMERVPNTRLRVVESGLPSFPGAHAVTSYNGDRITFNVRAEPAVYRAALSHDTGINWSTTGTPMGAAVHEYGHVIANSHDLNDDANSLLWDYVAARPDIASTSEAVEHEVSEYATTNSHELAAEAFSDVVVNGDQASELSHTIHDHLVSA